MEENTNKGLEQNTQTEEQTVKTYSEEEVAQLIQSEADRRVTQALKKAEEKFNKKMSEAEKLHDMDEAQRETYKLNQRIAELEELNKNYALAENKATLAKALSERGLPVQFVDYLVGEDAETMMNNVTEFEKAWKASVQDAVTAQLAKGTPRGNGTGKQSALTKEAFAKMTLAQQTELYNTNKALYMELSKR